MTLPSLNLLAQSILSGLFIGQLGVLVARRERMELIAYGRGCLGLFPPDLADQRYDRGGIEAAGNWSKRKVALAPAFPKRAKKR